MSDHKADTLSGAVPEKKARGLLVDLVVRLVKEKPLVGITCGAIFLLMFFTGVFADLVSPYPPNETHYYAVLIPPSADFILGTDQIGRDMLSRIIYGARISMTVGLVSPSIAMIVALLIGVPSGFIGGKFDLVVQRFVDAWYCLPQLIVLLTLMVITGSGLQQVVIVLGINFGIIVSRAVRSAVIGIRENMYIQAAEAIGAPTSRVLTHHILPNIMPVVIILYTMYMANAILAEAALSFLGFGVPPPQPSWGGMLSGEGRRWMLVAPWMALWPGLALSLAIFTISMLGDAVRDILDPRLRGGLGRYGRTMKKNTTQK